MSINVVDFIKNEYAEALAEYRELERKASEAHQERITALEPAIAMIGAELQKQRTLQTQLEQMKAQSKQLSLPVADVDNRLQSAMSEVSRLEAELAKRNNELSQAKELAAPPETDRLVVFRHLERKLRWDSKIALSVRAITNISELAAEFELPDCHVIVEGEHSNGSDVFVVTADGRLTKLLLWTGLGELVEIPVAESPARYPKDFLPRGLHWVASSNSVRKRSRCADERLPQLFFDRHMQFFWRCHHLHLSTEIEEFVHPLSEAVKEELESIGGTLTMTEPLSVELLERIRQQVDLRCGSTPIFILRNGDTTSIVNRSFDDWWGYLAGARWNDSVRGPLAKLAHLAKHDPRSVHWWELEYCGQYGFRVRTRDHTWLKGVVYWSRDAVWGNETLPLELHRIEGNSRYSVGRVRDGFVHVNEVQDENDS